MCLCVCVGDIDRLTKSEVPRERERVKEGACLVFLENITARQFSI